jgi:putative membrane protein
VSPLRRLAATGIERARSTKPVSWLTLVGVLLLPALIGGVLVAALYNPTERLDNMTAAIVNNDEPVTIQDQVTPLGRQLAAGLVEGSDDTPSNLTWVLSNEDDAAEGLADGTYQAVITIPEEFSAAATSAGQRMSGEDAEPEQARIEVTTAPDARLADEAITNQVATVAASSMGQMLSEATLSNVFIGFTTLGDQLSEAADGASQLADGAGEAQEGATALADGATQLGSGAGELATGATQLADGAGELAGGAGGISGGAAELSNGVAGIADGATGLADGASQLSTGATTLSEGLNGLAAGMTGDGTAENPGLVGGADNLADGAQQLATGLAGDGTAQNPGLAPSLRQLADTAAPIGSGLTAGADAIEQNGLIPVEITEGAAGVATGLTALSEECAATGASADFCERLAGYATGASTASTALGQVAAESPAALVAQLRGAAALTEQFELLATGAESAATGASGLAHGLREYAAGVATTAEGATALAGGASELSTGASQLSSGASELATGAGQAAEGAETLSTGAAQLATGANGLADGSAQLAGGAGELSTGAGQLATGTADLGDGIGELAGGTRSLADGLGTATEQIPSYTDDEADDLATVVADPVSSSAGGEVSLFGAAAVPLLAAIVLWFGGLATFLVMRSVTARALTSRRASVSLAGGALLPAAIVGAVQGVLVAAVVQVVSGYEAGTAAALFGLCALIGVAFAAVHQALVAVFGGAGHWIGALVGAVGIATGIVSTLPAWLAGISAAMPTAPAYRALLGAVTDAGGTGGAIVALLVWAVLAFIATTIAVGRKRTLPARALLEGVPA